MFKSLVSSVKQNKLKAFFIALTIVLALLVVNRIRGGQPSVANEPVQPGDAAQQDPQLQQQPVDPSMIALQDLLEKANALIQDNGLESGGNVVYFANQVGLSVEEWVSIMPSNIPASVRDSTGMFVTQPERFNEVFSGLDIGLGDYIDEAIVGWESDLEGTAIVTQIWNDPEGAIQALYGGRTFGSDVCYQPFEGVFYNYTHMLHLSDDSKITPCGTSMAPHKALGCVQPVVLFHVYVTNGSTGTDVVNYGDQQVEEVYEYTELVSLYACVSDVSSEIKAQMEHGSIYHKIRIQ